ncbi:hypothetical protein JXR93_00555 [bacterium]|nr:hypothetical protein [bacterium]
MAKYFFIAIIFSFVLSAAPEINQIIEEIPHYRAKVVSLDQEKHIITVTLLESNQTVKISPENGVLITFYGKKGKKQITINNIMPNNEISISSKQLYYDIIKKSVNSEMVYYADYLQID